MPTSGLLRPASDPIDGTLVPGFSLSLALIRTVLRTPGLRTSRRLQGIHAGETLLCD